jgi:hypothetical protein
VLGSVIVSLISTRLLFVTIIIYLLYKTISKVNTTNSSGGAFERCQQRANEDIDYQYPIVRKN